MTAQKYDMFFTTYKRTWQKAKVITPGIKAPTIMKLSEDNGGEVCICCSSHGTVKGNRQRWSLSALGATGILVMDIKNCRT